MNRKMIEEIHEKTIELRKTLVSCVSDDELMHQIERNFSADSDFAYCDFSEKKEMIQGVFQSLRKELGILSAFAEDDSITEIMVNGTDDVYIEKNAEMVKTELSFYTREELEDLIRRIAGKVHREFNELNPILDARLEDGSRVNGVYRNIALDGPALTIRKFPRKPFDMGRLIENGTITQEAADFLKKCVEAGYNIFISGGTSSGKTTFLNCLTDYIPKEERIVVIEDSAELQIRSVSNLVRLECRNANAQGIGKVSMTDLIRTSLRMRPNRIIVGEVRGREVSDMIDACNTGHDGSISTGHGNSAEGMLRRLESMYLQGAEIPVDAIRAQISEGLDIIVHLAKVSSGKRKVIEIAELDGIEGGNISLNRLYVYHPVDGLYRSENPMKHTLKFEMKGIEIHD